MFFFPLDSLVTSNTCFKADRNFLIALEKGGSLSMKGSMLYMNSSYFNQNAALFGSAVHFETVSLNALIENSIFENSYSYMGGIFAFLEDIKVMNTTIQRCYFNNNFGNRIEIIETRIKFIFCRRWSGYFTKYIAIL